MPNLNTDVKGQKVSQKPVFYNLVFENFGRQTRAVEQTKDQRGSLGIGLEPKPLLECAKVVERLLDDRQADNSVDDICVDAPAEPDPQ